MTRKFLGFILIILGIVVSVYAGILNRIQKAYIDRDFEKLEKLILKSIEKDTLNPGARYYYSVLFLDTTFNRFSIDSSSFFIEQSLEDYNQSGAEIYDDLADVGLTIDQLTRQRGLVAARAFHRADTTNQISGWKDFMERFSYSELLDQAIYNRDSLAYEDASEEHTWEAYKAYFETYPNSSFVSRAKEHYQVLLFKDFTKDDKTESYIAFLKKHPDTPFRNQTEEIIFERTTVFNKRSSYLQFVKNYPKSHLVKKAADIAYFLTGDKSSTDQEVFRLHPNADSLQTLHELGKPLLIPVLTEGKFGFMDAQGRQIISPYYSNVSTNYLCGDVLDNWLEVTTSSIPEIISRHGRVLLSGVLNYRAISPSLKIATTEESNLYHASGYKVLDQSVDDAVELPNGWISFKHRYNWGICTPSGKVILEPVVDQIDIVGPFVVLEKDDLLAITTVEKLGNGTQTLQFDYDDYELIQDTLMQVFYEEKEGVLDSKLDYLVPLEEQEVYISGSFWYLDRKEFFQMVKEDEAEIVDQEFESIEVNEGWLALKKEDWILLSRLPGGVMPMKGLDSVKLLNEFATFIQKGDTIDLLFQHKERVPLTPNNELSVFTRPGSETSYLSIQDGNEYKLIDQYANLLFLGDFDDLILMTDSLFKFKYRGKSGVKRTDGSNLISPEYDVIDEENELLFLLKEGKIGCYDLNNHVLIPAEYSARIKRVGPNYQVVKNGKNGLVNPVNKKVVSFDYDEMINWNDTTLWVRQGMDWSLINLDEEVLVSEVQNVKLWIKVDEEQLAIVSGEDGYGLYGNIRGEILPIEYNEIINVGTLDNPVFFAEQHLKAAELFVVTYFNKEGESIKSIPYRPQEYDLIYCDE